MQINNKKENMTHQAINCRIPKETYDSMQVIVENTKKSTAEFVKNCIEWYIISVEKELDSDYNPLKIDQFAYKLNRKEK